MEDPWIGFAKSVVRGDDDDIKKVFQTQSSQLRFAEYALCIGYDTQSKAFAEFIKGPEGVIV